MVFPQGLSNFSTTMLIVNFAFLELNSLVAAGETKTRRNVPKAINAAIWATYFLCPAQLLLLVLYCHFI